VDEAISDIERNTCATSHVITDNSRPVAYLILKVNVNERIKTDLSKNDVNFIPKNKIVHCLNNYPKHVIIFLILQTFNSLPRLNHKRWVRHIVNEIC
jgi:hypothetical protein